MNIQVNIQKKSPKAEDVAIGEKIKARRMALGMSQEKLAEQLGVTFQQVQKYENGTNRVSVSRMLQIAAALNAPPSWFFPAAAESRERPVSEYASIIDHPDTRALLKAFTALPKGVAQRRAVRVVEALSREGD